MANYESYVNAKHVFGHKRQSIIELTSTISIKKMCMANKDAFMAGLIENNSCNAYYNKNNKDQYIELVNTAMDALDNLEKCNGIHCGDCVKAPCSCELCHYENIYVEGLALLCDFEQLLRNKNAEIKDKIKRFNSEGILFMAIIQMEEDYWTSYNEYFYKCRADGVEKKYNIIIPEINELFEMFLRMSDNEQDERYNRMRKVREYAEDFV